MGILPLLLLGLLLIAAGLAVWIQGPRTPTVVTFAIMLVFHGDLHLVGVLWALPVAPDAAMRLWALFDIVVSASAVAFVVLFFQNKMTPRRLDSALSTVIGVATILAVAAVAIPSLYWGDGARRGPLSFVAGLRPAVFATIAWLLLRSPSLRTRPALSVLAIALLLEPVFWATTDLLYVHLVGAELGDVQVAPDHYGRLIAIVPVTLVLARLVRIALHHPENHEKLVAKRILLLALFPALSSVLLLDALALGLVTTHAANLLIVRFLAAAWTLALPATVAMLALKAPRAVGDALAARTALFAERRVAAAPLVVWD